MHSIECLSVNATSALQFPDLKGMLMHCSCLTSCHVHARKLSSVHNPEVCSSLRLASHTISRMRQLPDNQLQCVDEPTDTELVSVQAHQVPASS